MTNIDNRCTKLTRNDLCISQYKNVSLLHVYVQACFHKKQKTTLFTRALNCFQKSIKISSYNFRKKFVGLSEVKNVRFQRRHMLTVDVATDHRLKFCFLMLSF